MKSAIYSGVLFLFYYGRGRYGVMVSQSDYHHYNLTGVDGKDTEI